MPTLGKFVIFFLITSFSVYYFTKNSGSESVPIIKAPFGQLKGALLQTKYGRNIFAYRGIPFAKPPIGDLRFKRPQPLPDNSWPDIFDASGSVSKCVQPSEIPSLIPIKGEEDCLQLNVYVPDSTPPKDGYPIMAWFHGGGFTSGDSGSRLYGPEYLMDHDVILVTSNYRLGIFGFLTLGIEEISGNQGMWDQLETLKWVQRNIKAFGGNEKRVTIFGESAGGYSVGYHLTSKQSKNLFNAAIGNLTFILQLHYMVYFLFLYDQIIIETPAINEITINAMIDSMAK